MAKQFRYNDNLGNILNSSPEPIMGETSSNKTKYEGFEDYMKLDISDYDLYSEVSPDTPAKYTMISKPQPGQSPNKPEKEQGQPTKKTGGSESKGYQDYDDPPMIAVPDVIASKMFEQSKMSTINTVYIGSLTIIGLYVLFRYMKY
jgi:hypothetical protein